MQLTQLVRTLGPTDLKLLGRDRFLLVLLGFIVYIGVLMRFGLPWLNTYLAANGVLPSETAALHLSDVYPMLVAFFAIFDGALIAGTVSGFMLIDEKDDRTLQAMLVTPVPFRQFVLYRVGVPAVMSVFIVTALVLFIGQALVPLWQLLLIAAGASLAAPMVALFYAIFSANKVQGFAMAKFVGIAGWVILVGWFIDEPWQWLFGLFPPFLVSKAYWLAFAGDARWWLALVAGIVLQLGMLWVMVRRFHAVAYR